jgi:tRNA/tmRNA/rRNA uracil-C5-methylase (TrmA/RlmC/RlmD family)
LATPSPIDTPQDDCVVRIEALAAGGDGVGRDAEGRVVFVPLTAPGDRVRVRIERRRKRHAHGSVVELLEPGSGRVTPPCSVFGSCGGCTWQHLDYPVQLEAKAGIVRDALARIAGLALEAPPEIHPSTVAYGYRRRTRVSVEGGRVGFRRRRSREVCAVDRCPVLTPALDRELGRLVAGAPARDGEWELSAAGETTRAVDLARLRGTDLVLEVGAERVATSPGVFSQANEWLLPELVDRVVASAGEGLRAVELYAGAGLFTLPLARRFEAFLAVEGHDAAAADLARNLTEAGLDRVELRSEPVEGALRRLAGEAPDVLVLDPPRSGLPPGGAAELAAVAPARIVYLSCDPATLARDLRTLCEAGYRLSSVEAFDLFPQTPHVEALVTLDRDSIPPA